jgi:hypothetical protein
MKRARICLTSLARASVLDDEQILKSRDSQDVHHIGSDVPEHNQSSDASNLFLEVDQLCQGGTGDVMKFAEVDRKSRSSLQIKRICDIVQYLRSELVPDGFDDLHITEVYPREPKEVSALGTWGITGRIGRLDLEIEAADRAMVGLTFRRP